jgi:hypothetical protein
MLLSGMHTSIPPAAHLQAHVREQLEATSADLAAALLRQRNLVSADAMQAVYAQLQTALQVSLAGGVREWLVLAFNDCSLRSGRQW